MKKQVSWHPSIPSIVRTSVLVLITALAVAAVSGCSKKDAVSPLAPTSPNSLARAPATPGGIYCEGESHMQGDIGPGAHWRIDKPAAWNGDLVIWIQGNVVPRGPVAPPDNGAAREALFARGYGIVTASWDQDCFNLKDALATTHQMHDVFAHNLGADPLRTYIVGVSLGGLVGAMLIDTYGTDYAGGMLVSAPVGGSAYEMRYVGDMRTLFDVVYPGVLPGTLLDIPTNTEVGPAVVAARSAINADIAGLEYIHQLARVECEHLTTAECANSVLAALTFQMENANNILSRSGASSFYDNHDWTYEGPLPTAVVSAVNASVARFEGDPAMMDFVTSSGTPSGSLPIPLITLHDAWDPLVPETNEDAYADAVAAHGESSNLLQRRVQRYGHYNFSTAELMASFDDLTHWVETGIKPAP